MQQAYADGVVTHEEFDRRLDQVLVARTREDVESALSSLPDPGRSAQIGAIAGRIRRAGVWRVPRRLKVESAFGTVQLDLSRAIFEQSEVEIELKLGTGSARIKVPRDAVVDIDGFRSTWKDSQYLPPRQSTGTGPRIRITGSLGFGKLRIRHARR